MFLHQESYPEKGLLCYKETRIKYPLDAESQPHHSSTCGSFSSIVWPKRRPYLENWHKHKPYLALRFIHSLSHYHSTIPSTTSIIQEKSAAL